MDLDLGVHKLVPFGLRVSQEVAAKMLAGTSVISTVAEGFASMMAHSHGCWLGAYKSSACEPLQGFLSVLTRQQVSPGTDDPRESKEEAVMPFFT